MEDIETQPRRQLIIKLYLPRSKKNGPPSEPSDTHCKKKRKVGGSEVSATKPKSKSKTLQCNTEYSAVAKIETRCSIVKENTSAVAKDSRTVSEECDQMKEAADSHSKKMRKVATEVSAMARNKNKTQCDVVKENLREGSRISRSGSDNECKLKKEGEECKKEKKPRVVQMDRYKKIQCWVILKRLMIGRDGWAFKQPQYLKDLEILDNSVEKLKMGLENNIIKSELNNNNSETILKPIGLKDIDSKLNKWLYSGPDEFADDIRLVFSYALLYPPGSAIYSIARRLSENFELSWKSLKEKWSSTEEGKGRKMCKRAVCTKVDRHAARELWLNAM